MNARRDPDRLIHAFLIEGQTELADQVYDAVRSTVERRRQRVFIGPWRFPDMNKLVPIGLGAAAVVGVLFLGSRQLGPPSGPGGSPSVEPSPSPTPTVAASSPSASSAAPPLTETFTSERHGISISYPAGWVTRPADEPWTTGLPDWLQTNGDVFDDPVRSGSLWIVVASQPIGESTPDEWVAETLTLSGDCGATEPIAVDDASGRIGAYCNEVAVTTDGRGYFIWLHTSPDDPSLSLAYDRAWFEEVLATVQLQPADAVDVAPSTSP